MGQSNYSDRDVAILSQMRELTGNLDNKRTQGILRSMLDAVALNPQPLPPRVHDILQAFIGALNPQPLPPAPPPENSRSA